MYGNYRANLAQIEAEVQNSRYYKIQADLVRTATYREAEIASSRYEARKGAQISAVFKGGADLSGSTAAIVASTIAQKADELSAIKQKGEADFILASLRQQNSNQKIADLADPTNNILQSASIGLGAAAKTNNFGLTDGRAKGGTTDGSTYKSHISGGWNTMSGNSGTTGYGLGGNYNFKY
jgi:hypothetical protein